MYYRDKVIQHLRIHDPVNWVEDKDPACDKATLELVDEQVVPPIGDPFAIFSLVGRFCGICNL